jgi:hypothetical protein
MSPAEIAARLTKAQRAGMAWLAKGDGSPPGWIIGAATLTLCDLGLHEFGRLTPLGLAVRAEIERMEKQDGE